MKTEVIQAFISAVRDVLVQEMGEPVEPQKPRLQGGPCKMGDITVIVGLTRDIEGAVLLGLSKSTATNYLSHVMGEVVDELDDLALSGIGELGNMIAGSAGAKLAEKGFETIISPPTLLLGADSTISTLNVPRLVVPVNTPCGLVDLQLAARLKN